VRVTWLLYTASVGLATLAAGFWAAPLSLEFPDTGRTRHLAAVASPVAAPRAAAPMYESVIASNVFSKTRLPPVTRFTPPGSSRLLTPPGGEKTGATFTLYGTALGPAGAVALIRPDVMGAPPRLYGVGDTAGSGRLVAVTESTATLDRKAGFLVLRLQNGPGAKP
jgi:hypothetical protein